eukprot:369503-Amphidinium_carterae.2
MGGLRGCAVTIARAASACAEEKSLWELPRTRRAMESETLATFETHPCKPPAPKDKRISCHLNDSQATLTPYLVLYNSPKRSTL